MYKFLFPPIVKGLKDVLEMFQKKDVLDKIRSIPSAVFFEKAVLKIFRKFLENNLWQSTYWKLITMLNNIDLCHWCFSRDFPKIFRTAILKEKPPMHVSYFIKEHLGMGATDEVTPKKTFDGSKPSSKLTLIRLWTQITFCYRKCMLPHTLTLIGYNISGCLLFGCPICDKIFHFCPKQP